jgi:hypothetical protein
MSATGRTAGMGERGGQSISYAATGGCRGRSPGPVGMDHVHIYLVEIRVLIGAPLPGTIIRHTPGAMPASSAPARPGGPTTVFNGAARRCPCFDEPPTAQARRVHCFPSRAIATPVIWPRTAIDWAEHSWRRNWIQPVRRLVGNYPVYTIHVSGENPNSNRYNVSKPASYVSTGPPAPPQT